MYARYTAAPTSVCLGPGGVASRSSTAVRKLEVVRSMSLHACVSFCWLSAPWLLLWWVTGARGWAKWIPHLHLGLLEERQVLLKCCRQVCHCWMQLHVQGSGEMMARSVSRTRVLSIKRTLSSAKVVGLLMTPRVVCDTCRSALRDWICVCCKQNNNDCNTEIMGAVMQGVCRSSTSMSILESNT